MTGDCSAGFYSEYDRAYEDGRRDALLPLAGLNPEAIPELVEAAEGIGEPVENTVNVTQLVLIERVRRLRAALEAVRGKR